MNLSVECQLLVNRVVFLAGISTICYHSCSRCVLLVQLPQSLPIQNLNVLPTKQVARLFNDVVFFTSIKS